MSGVFVDECPEPEKLNNLELYYKPWFYKHVEGTQRSCPALIDGIIDLVHVTEGYLKKKETGVEYHTTLGFFHRQNKVDFCHLL